MTVRTRCLLLPSLLFLQAWASVCRPAAAQGVAPPPSAGSAAVPIDPANYSHPVRVACVGDSITAGAGTSRGRPTSWDGVLGRMLDRHWRVGNFGSSGRTLLQHGDIPYQTKGAMKKALESKPDVVIIMLGTNDTKPQNWKFKDEFIGDYKNMIDQFKALPTHPRIILCTPPTVVGPGKYRINEAGVDEELPMIHQIADDEGAAVIDVHAATADLARDFPDNVHPNDQGSIAIARTVYAALTGQPYVGDPPPPPPPPPRPATQPAAATTRP